MTTTTQAYGVTSAQSEVGPMEIERRDLRPEDVAIEISHCGICHSDLHMAHNDWGMSQYPMVPGHEIVGTVTAVGSGRLQVQAGRQGRRRLPRRQRSRVRALQVGP